MGLKFLTNIDNILPQNTLLSITWGKKKFVRKWTILLSKFKLKHIISKFIGPIKEVLSE